MAVQAGDGGGDHPDRGDAHRGERPGQPLRQAEAEVDAELVVRRTDVREREQRGDRPGLRQPQCAVPVDGPLGVLRLPVVLLHPGAECDQRAQLVVGHACGVRCRPSNGFRAAARTRADDEALVPQPPFEHGTGPAVEHEVVRVDRPADHGLAQAGAGVDDGLSAPSRHRVDGEHHAGHRRVHHPLHHHGEPGLGMVDPVAPRYTTARSVQRDAQQRWTASRTASAPVIPR